MKDIAVGSDAWVDAQSGDDSFATLNRDGSVVVDWAAVRKMAADVRKARSAEPPEPVTEGACIAALLWAVAQPGVTP